MELQTSGQRPMHSGSAGLWERLAARSNEYADCPARCCLALERGCFQDAGGLPSGWRHRGSKLVTLVPGKPLARGQPLSLTDCAMSRELGDLMCDNNFRESRNGLLSEYKIWPLIEMSGSHLPPCPPYRSALTRVRKGNEKSLWGELFPHDFFFVSTHPKPVVSLKPCGRLPFLS